MTRRCHPISGLARCALLCRLGLLLIVVGLVALQPAAHASPGGHSVHQDQAVATVSHCTQFHASGDHGADPAEGTGSSAVDCQLCLTAAVPLEPLTLAASVNGELFSVTRPDPCERSPEGILRPPRLIAA